MAQKLTKKLIDSFEYEGDGKLQDLRWDTEMRGFGVRIYPSGIKSFIMTYRQNGTKRIYVIAQYGQITLEQARELTKKRFGEIADRRDPLLEKRATKKKHEWTVKRAFEDFLNHYAKKRNKHWEETDRIFKKDILPSLESTAIDEVKKDDIIKILDKIRDRNSGIMANRTLAHVKKFFQWCLERNLIEFSPVMGIGKPAAEIDRDRVLYDYEIKEIWNAAQEMGFPFGYCIQFLILTGQRRGEIAAMRWEDYNKKEQLWTLPKEFTKTNRQHEVPISDFAAEIIKACHKLLQGDYVFTSAGNRPFENFSRDKELLDDAINTKRKMAKQPPMQPWRIHDIRRTVATGMAKLGVAPHVVQKVQNHSTGAISGIAAIYNRYEYADEKREALDQWAAQIQKILTDKSEKKDKNKSAA